MTIDKNKAIIVELGFNKKSLTFLSTALIKIHLYYDNL